MNYLTAYQREIESGKVTVCEKTRKIYRRLADEIEADEGRWTFSEAKANAPIDFIERFCKHSKGEWAGKPVRLELWQKAFIAGLFGFVDRQTGERRFTEALLCLGRPRARTESQRWQAASCSTSSYARDRRT